MKKLRDLSLSQVTGGALATPIIVISPLPPIGPIGAQGDRTRRQTYVDGNTWDQDWDCQS